MIACDVVRKPSRGHEVAMEDLRSKGWRGVWSPPDPGKGWRGDQLMLQAGGRGVVWKVDGCLLVLESSQNNGGAPSF